MLNSLGREIPEYIEGIGKLEPFQGALTKLSKGWMNLLSQGYNKCWGW